MGNFETFDGFVEFLLFCIKNPEAVVSGGVFFVEFQDSQKGFFGTEGFVVAHGSLGSVPEFFHLHIIASATWGFGFFVTKNWAQKRKIERENDNNENA